MITLTKYLYGKEPAASAGADSAEAFCAALTQLATVLLTGLEQQVFREPHSAFQAFTLETQKLRERLQGNATLPDIHAATAEFSSLLENFRRVRDHVQQTEAAEVQKMVAMLNDTVAVLSHGSERSLERLRQVETDLKHASALGDIVALKARLGDCMHYVREQSLKEREETAGNLAKMKRDVQRAQEGFALARGGVLGRADAEQSITVAVGKSEVAVAIFVLDRFSSLKARFSPVVGERFLSLFVQDLSQLMPSPHKIFRWNDSSILVELADTKLTATQLAELRERLAKLPRERQLDVGQRLAVFSNGHRWTLLRPAESASVAAAILRIEQFAKL